MTTRVLDRPNRSTQITLLASIAAGVAGVAVAAAVALTAFGGGRGSNDDPVVPPIVNPSPSAPPATPVPAPDETPEATPTPDSGGSDAMPIKVDLENATGDDVFVDIVDGTGLLVDAHSGTPGDGMSVEPDTLAVANIDATTLKLTWVDYPIDNALALYIDEHEGGTRLLLVQPEPAGPTDSIGFDRELILSFSEPISAEQVETILQGGLDTPG